MEMRGGAIHRDNSMASWSQEVKSKANELRESATNAAHDLFRSGDLCGYLDLVCRLNCYDAYNLLLLLQQYPKATCLAGFKQWQKLLNDPTAQVLRPEWRGKGIDLIAPYTDVLGSERYSLTWFAVKQFDISQTNVTSFHPAPSVYTEDKQHLSILQSALEGVAATEYHRSVVHTPASSQLRSIGLAGRMNDSTILLRDDTKPSVRLHFLSECLCRLAMEPVPTLTASQTDLAAQYIIHCLFRIWCAEPPHALRQPRAELAAISPDSHMDFLSLIRRTVRHLDESVSCAYRSSREGEELHILPDDDYIPHPEPIPEERS